MMVLGESIAERLASIERTYPADRAVALAQEAKDIIREHGATIHDSKLRGFLELAESDPSKLTAVVEQVCTALASIEVSDG